MPDTTTLTQQQILKKIQKLAQDPQIAASAIVRLADPLLTMPGRQVNDHISNPDHYPRRSVQLSSYPRYAAGAAGIMVHQDKDKNIYIAFVTKCGHAKCDSSPIPLLLPGGYALAAPLKGGEQGLGPFTREQMSEAEIGLLRGDPHSYQKVAARYGITASTPWQKPIIDATLAACVIRELEANLGKIIVKPELVKIKNLIYSGYKNPIPVIDATYLLDYGQIRPKFYPTQKKYQEVIWVRADKIKIKLDSQDAPTFIYQHRNQELEIGADNMEQVDAALKKLRSKDYQLGSREAACRLIGYDLRDYPEFECSQQAALCHQHILQREAITLQQLNLLKEQTPETPKERSLDIKKNISP